MQSKGLEISKKPDQENTTYVNDIVLVGSYMQKRSINSGIIFRNADCFGDMETLSQTCTQDRHFTINTRRHTLSF